MEKPTGKLGFCRIQGAKGEEIKKKFHKLHLPSTKDDIEEAIVSGFLKTKIGSFISEVVKNKLDDFDFTITTSKGTAQLELMEIAPLELYKCSYHDAPNTYDSHKMAINVVNKIWRKSEKYPPTLADELFLLLYVTDFKFNFSEMTIDLIRYFLGAMDLKFNAIFMFKFVDDHEGLAQWIYPIGDKYFEDFDPESYRGKVLILDVEQFTLTKTKEGVVEFRSPPISLSFERDHTNS